MLINTTTQESLLTWIIQPLNQQSALLIKGTNTDWFRLYMLPHVYCYLDLLPRIIETPNTANT